MSRVYEALQRSQGESPNPSASPLVTDQPEAAAGAAAVAEEMSGVPLAPAEPADASWLKVPAERVLHPVPTPEQRLVTMTDPDSTGAEMFRVLATRLAHMRRKRNLHKLLITSSVVDEGKSVVASNLAFTLARRSGERVLLIEADLRRPSISPLLSDYAAARDLRVELRASWRWRIRSTRSETCQYGCWPPVMPMEEPLPLLESGPLRQDAGERFAELRLGADGCHAAAAHGRLHLDRPPVRWRSGGGARRLHPQEGAEQGALPPSTSPSFWAWSSTRPPC